MRVVTKMGTEFSKYSDWMLAESQAEPGLDGVLAEPHDDLDLWEGECCGRQISSCTDSSFDEGCDCGPSSSENDSDIER